MPHIQTDDHVQLYYEATGQGAPIIWVHEFAGDHRSWEAQVRFFSRRYRCIAYAARGYPPSGVPASMDDYSQARAARDIGCVLDALRIERAHVVGLSMGGFAALHFGLMFPERALSLTIAGVGYGSEAEHADTFRRLSHQVADQFEALGSPGFAPIYAEGASRVQLQNKDPRGWTEFVEHLSQHDAAGAARTMRGVQARRPSLYTLQEALQGLDVPALIMTGDEDDHCLQPSLFLKRTLPRSGLLVLPKTGHTINLEEPDLFNRAVLDFLHSVEAGRWTARDPRATQEIMKVAADPRPRP